MVIRSGEVKVEWDFGSMGSVGGESPSLLASTNRRIDRDSVHSDKV